MQQTLITLPHEIAGLSIFGFGWVLICWAIFGGVWLTHFYMQSAQRKEEGVGHPLVPILIIGVIIAFIIPFTLSAAPGLVAGVSILLISFFRWVLRPAPCIRGPQ